MYKYSIQSEIKLGCCDSRLARIFEEVITMVDISIITSYRDLKKQKELYREGLSKVEEGKHNVYPSLAVDAAPYPIKWDSFKDIPKNRARFYFLAGIVKAIAVSHDVKIRWGGDWDGDNDFNDQTFDDLCHWEIVE